MKELYRRQPYDQREKYYLRGTNRTCKRVHSAFRKVHALRHPYSFRGMLWKFPHFPQRFPHFPHLIGYTHLAKLLYGALLLRCKLNIILNGKRTSLRWCGWHLKSDLMQDVRAWGWLAAIKPESDAGHRGLRLADNDKISHEGHRAALRCCRCPFYFVAVQFSAE